MGLFSLGARRDPARAETIRRIAALVRAELGLGDADSVTVSEIACGDPACGGAETVILVMRRGQRTRATKVSKSLALVTDSEIVAALEAVAE